MKLPISLLLYVVALGLLGLAGWTLYGMRSIWSESARTAASNRGIEQGRVLVDTGRGANTQTADWAYDGRTKPWFLSFKELNLIGKLPPPPPDPTATADGPKEPVVTVDMRPLEEILEIVALVHDEQEGQANSYAIVRYKPTVKVDPPEWWVKENVPVASGAAVPGTVSPRDAIPAAPSGRQPRGPQGRGRGPQQPQAPTAMPTSGLTGREIMQVVYVHDDPKDERHSSRLWPEFSHIHLVRVADDARSAWFLRDIPPAKAGDKPPEPKEDHLFKTSQNLSQDMMRALAEIEGRQAATAGTSAPKSGELANNTGWVDVEETTRDGNNFNIGRKDQTQFQQSEDFFDHLDVDVYRGSSMRGLIVRNVDQKLATKFGVAPGDVLLEVNNQTVESKAQALQIGKSQYNRGVRTFVTKWLSNGTVVERTYQAPPK